MGAFPLGKLPYENLAQLLAKNRINDSRVLIGPRCGEDAAVITFNERLLVVKSDPITFTSDHMGWYVVHINANDIAVMGGEPKWLLVTALLPEHETDELLIDRILEDVFSACRELNISLVGGHTEVTPHLDRPILVGHMLGETTANNLIDKRTIRPGDLILITKGIAIEGTAVIAREKHDELAAELTEELLDRAQRFIYEPGLSVVRDARIAIAHGDIHGMHDPTEGGLLGGIFELINGLDLGVEVYESKIPVFPETIEFCRYFGLDPLRLLASGALMVIAPPEQMVGLQLRYKKEGIDTAIIGRVVESHEKIRIKRHTGWDQIYATTVDEITKIF